MIFISGFIRPANAGPNTLPVPPINIGIYQTCGAFTSCAQQIFHPATSNFIMNSIRQKRMLSIEAMMNGPIREDFVKAWQQYTAQITASELKAQTLQGQYRDAVLQQEAQNIINKNMADLQNEMRVDEAFCTGTSHKITLTQNRLESRQHKANLSRALTVSSRAPKGSPEAINATEAKVVRAQTALNNYASTSIMGGNVQNLVSATISPDRINRDVDSSFYFGRPTIDTSNINGTSEYNDLQVLLSNACGTEPLTLPSSFKIGEDKNMDETVAFIKYLTRQSLHKTSCAHSFALRTAGNVDLTNSQIASLEERFGTANDMIDRYGPRPSEYASLEIAIKNGSLPQNLGPELMKDTAALERLALQTDVKHLWLSSLSTNAAEGQSRALANLIGLRLKGEISQANETIKNID